MKTTHESMTEDSRGRSTVTRRTAMNMLTCTAIAGTAIATPAATADVDDRTFALIEAHRTAVDAHSKAFLDISRREEILLNEGSGLCPFVAIADKNRPVVAYTHAHIDSYSHSSEQIRERAHAALQAAIERNRAVMGDVEEVGDSAGATSTEAWVELLSTPPQSMAGIRSLLAYILREVDDINDELGDLAVSVLTSIEDALETVNPTV